MSHSWGSRHRGENDVFVTSCIKCGCIKYWVKSVPTFKHDGIIYVQKAPKCDNSLKPAKEPLILNDFSDYDGLWDGFKEYSGYDRVLKYLLSIGLKQPHIDNIMRIPFDFAYNKLKVTTLTRDKTTT